MNSTIVEISDAVKALSQIVDEREAKTAELIEIRLGIKRANQRLMVFQRQLAALNDTEKQIIRQLAREKRVCKIGDYEAKSFI